MSGHHLDYICSVTCLELSSYPLPIEMCNGCQYTHVDDPVSSARNDRCPFYDQFWSDIFSVHLQWVSFS